MKKFMVCFLTLLMLIQPGFTGFLPAPAALRAEEPSGGPDDPIPFVYGENTAASLSAGESKYFTFTPDVTGTYIFFSSGATGAPEISLRRNEPWSYVFASNKGGLGNNFYLPVTLVSGELYYVTLSANAEARFSFSVLRTADDHANQSDLASPFSFENGAAGWLEYTGDTDVFTLTPLRTVAVELSADTAAVYKLTVDGRTLDSPPYLVTMYAGYSYDIAITDISNQTFDFQPRPYTLRLDPLVDDAGDYEEAAEPLTEDNPRVGRINYEGDLDYYSFRSETGGAYFLSVEGSAGVYYVPYNYAINAGEKSFIQISAGEIHYFYVYGNEGNDYTVLLTPQPDDYMNWVDYETAEPSLTLGEEISGALEYAEDVDAFRLAITEPGYYSLTTTGLSEPQSVRFDYEQLLGAGFSERFLSPRISYINVDAAGVTGAYTLIVQKEDKPLPPDPEGNTAAEAMPLPAPPSYSGALDYDGDQDWFVFTTTGEQELYLADSGEYYSANLTILTEDGRQICRLNSYESAAVALEPNTAYYIRADGYPYDGGAYSFTLTVMDYNAAVWENAGENALRFGGVLSAPEEYFLFTAPVSGHYTLSLAEDDEELILYSHDYYLWRDSTEFSHFLAQGQTVLLSVTSESSQPSPFTMTAEWIEDDYPGEGNWWQAPLMDLDASYTMRYDFRDDYIDGLRLPPGLSGPYTFIAEGAYLTIAYEEDGQLAIFDTVDGYDAVSAELTPDKQYYIGLSYETEVGATVVLRALAGGDDYPNGVGDYIENRALTMTATGEIEYASDVDVMGFRPFFGPVRFSVSAERPLKAEIFTTDEYYATVRLAEASGTEIDFPYIFSPANPDFWQYQQGSYYLRLTAAEAGDTGIDFAMTAAQLDDYGDDFADARVVELEQSLTGAISFAGDTDVFRFTPLITAAHNFDFGSAGADLEWTLCDLTGAELLSGSGPEFARTLKAFAPYYLRLSGGSEADYALTVSYVPPDDYGNGPADAYALAEGALNGVIDYNNDMDYFSVKPLETSHYSLSGSGQYALIAEITESDGAVIAASTGEEFSLRAKFQAGQTYYFSLRAAYRDRLGPYSFTLTRLEDEAGESPKDSLPIALPYGEEQTLGFAGDTDYYAVTPQSGGTHTFRSQGDLDLTAALLDGEGTVLAVSDDEGTEQNFYIIAPLTQGETYYLAVQGKTGTETGKYYLSVKKETDDVGDSAAEALVVSVPHNRSYRLDYPGDADYFTLEAAGGEILVITFDGTTPVAGTLYDEAGALLTAKSISDRDRSLTWTAAAGRYYLAVRHQLDQGKYNGTAYGDYTLRIQADWTPPTAPGNFRAALSGEDVLISFDPSADDTGVLEYDIYRNGRLLAATAQTSYTDRAVQWNTAYTYYAQARDRAGRRSPQSASAEIVTEADTTPPTAPWLYLAGYSDKAVTLAWMPSEDRSGIYRYLVFRNGSQIASLNANTWYYTDRDDFRLGETHGYYIKAIDNNGLESTSDYQSVNISSRASIEQIYPLTGAALGRNAELTALALSDSLGGIRLAVRAAGESEWTEIGDAALSGTAAAHSFVWNTEEWADGEYEARFTAYSDMGVESEPYIAAYSLHLTTSLTPPALAYSITPDTMNVELNWPSVPTAAAYDIYRRIGESGEQMFIARVDTPSFTNELGVDGTYYYTVRAMDVYSNAMDSEVLLVEVPFVDVIAPEASLGFSARRTVLGETILSAEDSSDNVGIVEYEWTVDGAVIGHGIRTSHNFTELGVHMVFLSARDEAGHISQAEGQVEVVDPEGTEMSTVTVFDKSSGSRLARATVQVMEEGGGGEVQELVTDANGTCVFVLDKEREYVGRVYRNGYTSRSFTVDKSGSAVSLSTEPPITGKLTWERMDMAAILAAGIDVRDPANQQVYKFTIQMTLSQSVTMHVNGNGTVLHNSGASGNAQVIPPQRPGQAPQVVYIEIDGEARWLKEMFDVKLLVFNTSEVDLVTNADAELVLPQGLSLAGMKSGLQFQKVRIGEIEPGASSETHWYVRGDKEGEYELSAKFHGLLMPFADEINIEFRADKKLKVYAGRAMEMHVFYMREIVDGFMPILVQLKNVVDFSIYNLSLELADYRYEITDDDGNLIQDTVTGSGRSAYVSELRPGENLNILYHVDFADIEGMNIVDDAFVEQLLVVTRDGSTTEIPVYITEIDGRDTTTTLPGGMKVDSDGRKEMPNGTVIWPDGRVELPDGTVIWPGGLITFSDAWSTRIDADRNVTGVIQGIFMPVPPPEGVTIEEDGTVTLPDGTVVGPDGRVTLPDGTVVLPGGYVILPDGTMINPDGTRAPGKYFPDGMKQPADGIQTGFFSYASHSDKKDYPARYYYSDEYFSGISSEYNPSLATMSMCLTMSAFGSNIVDYPEKSVNAKALLTELGFTGFAASPGFLIKPEKDTIGAVAAHKKVVFGEDEDKDEYTLIAAAVRGGGYMGEWASNFTIGTSGTHQGFNEAKEQVFDFLDGYVKSQGITGEVKVWITGYSRAGATANLVAGEIDGGRRVGGIGGIGGIAVKPENLYAYTFETPAGALESAVRSEKLYKNIFNHLNPHDPVSRVAPARWDFVRYGEDIYFPFRGDRTYLTELLPAMLAQHEQLQSESGYIVDDFVRWQTSIIDILTFKLTETESRGFQNYFLDEAVDMLIGEMFVSRPNYVSVWQADMREILYVAMGLDAADKSRFETYLRQELWDALPQLLPLAMEAGAAFISSEAARKSPNPIIWLGGHALSVAKDHALVELRDKLLECLMNSLNQAGITNYTSGDVERMADYLTVAVAGLFNSHRDEVVTIIANLKRLGAAHYPELCLAWLRAMDGNYANKVIVFDKIFGYTTVSINCPVDIEVYDESDRLVAVIAGDEAPDLGSEVLAVVNQDGEKLFYLPAHESYRLEIKATADGSMSYAVQERSLDTGGVQRLVAYYDLPLLAGDRYTAFVSAHDTDDPEGSNMEYSLLDVEGRPAAAAEELRGEKAAEAYYMIDVWTAEPERGTALGGGVRRLGHYAQVTAMATPGHIFAGWYEDEEMVSAEAEYRFAARRNMALEARFDSDPQGPGDSDLQNPDTQDPNDPDPQSPDDPDPQNPGGSDPQNPNPQDPNTSDPQAPNNPDPGSQTPDPPNPDQQPPKPTSPWRGSVSTPSIAGSAPVSIGGANRVLTSIAISRYGWTTADTVIIASGADANLVDALAAAPLAGQENAPILLCLGDELDPTVLEELRRLNPEKIYTVGAVSPAVIDRLTAETDWSVESLKGRDRFETAALIGAKVENPQGVFVVGYNAVADAVSAASYAAAHGYLIQIARPDGWLARPLPTDHLYILGGPALVQDIPGAERIAGLDRYATNQALRDTLTFNSEHIYIADGLTLVDALTGSALAAQTGSAIVLSPRDNISNADLDADSKVYVLGGGNE